MKNTIQKIIIAAVFFAAGLSNISANAQQTYGYYITSEGGFGFSNVWTATGYSTAELAEDAAVQNCEENAGGTENDCRTFYTDRGVFGDMETNQVVLWSDESTGTNYIGFGVDFAAAYADFFAKCVTARSPGLCNAETAYAEENVLSCGIGTAEDLTDDCGERFTPPLNCNFGTTTGVDGDGDGNCDCAFDTQIQVDTENCRAAESLEECMDEGFMYFDTITGECTDTDPAPTCTDNARLNEAITSCECDPAFPILVQIDGRNVFSCRAIETMDCTGETPFFDNNACVATCPDDRPLTESDGITCRPIDAADCGQDSRPDFWNGSMCVADCGDNFVNPANAGETCRPIAEVLATVSVSPTYTAESCENARWETEFVFSGNRQEVAEVCGIPVVRNDNLPAAAARESQPQIADGEMATGCIIRESSNFLTLPDCGDPELFGNDGFPQMPADFNLATDRLIIVVVADGRNRIFFNDNEIRIAVAPPRNNDAEVAIIGAVGVAMAMYAIADFLHDGRPADAFAFSPEFGYRISENDYFVQAGGKIEYAVNENLRMQWSAGQTNTGGDFGDFRYLSKAEYKTDLFAAEFSESVAGKTADYDFSLSADLQNGIWKISPVYRMQSEWKESDSGIKTETQNELNLESVLRYNRWTIRPSAGFRWENANDFANNGKLQMNAVYRF